MNTFIMILLIYMTISGLIWLLEGTMIKKEQIKRQAVQEKHDFEKIATATAKDLVDLSQLVRKVLANSTFNYNIIKDVQLLEAITKNVLENFVKSEKQENNLKEDKNE